MKQFIYTVGILLFYSCGYTLYGIALDSPKENSIESGNYSSSYITEIPLDNTPKSIILIIADGTGIGQYTTSFYGNGDFAPARFDHIGLVATHPDDEGKKVTDSASSGTALATGQKTYNGAISVDHNKKPIKTIVEIAEKLGMKTGLVATSTITHATPACFGAHVDSRSKENEIAIQLAQSEIDVLLGGGRSYWGDEIISDFKKSGGNYYTEFDNIIQKSGRVVGLFSEGSLPEHNSGREPTTVNMTKKAVEFLEDALNGFFLMVEESQVDWGGHSNNAEYILGEMASLNEVVNYCLDYQELHPEVLVVLTADHECGGVAVHDSEDGKLDIRFTSGYHTAGFVPIWATGPGAEIFDSFMDNTDIGKILIEYVRNR